MVQNTGKERPVSEQVRDVSRPQAGQRDESFQTFRISSQESHRIDCDSLGFFNRELFLFHTVLTL